MWSVPVTVIEPPKCGDPRRHHAKRLSLRVTGQTRIDRIRRRKAVVTDRRRTAAADWLGHQSLKPSPRQPRIRRSISSIARYDGKLRAASKPTAPGAQPRNPRRVVSASCGAFSRRESIPPEVAFEHLGEGIGRGHLPRNRRTACRVRMDKLRRARSGHHSTSRALVYVPWTSPVWYVAPRRSASRLARSEGLRRSLSARSWRGPVTVSFQFSTAPKFW